MTRESQPAASIRPPRRRRRWWARLLLILGLAAAVTGFVVTRSAVLIPLIEPILAREIGGEVRIGAAKIAGPRKIVLLDVVVQSPDDPGDPGEVLRVSAIRLRTSILSLLLGRSADFEITLIEPRFRVSEDAHHPNRFTFLSLRRSGDDSASESGLIVHVERGLVEVGTHEGERFTLSGSLRVGGTLHSWPDNPDLFSFDMTEINERGHAVGADGILVKGKVNVRTLETEGRVDGLVFSDRIRKLCPLMLQEWWKRLELDGRVSTAQYWLSEDTGLRAQLVVEDVGLTIPLPDPKKLWSRYVDGRRLEPEGLPRMRVERGQIWFEQDTVHLRNLVGTLTSNLGEGEVAGVPYEVSGSIGPLPDLLWVDRSEWGDRVLEQTPLVLSFYLRDFEYDSEAGAENSVIELPRQVTSVFERFNIQSCTLDMNIEIRRDRPLRDDGGDVVPAPLRTFGTATISDGRGAYAKFPYPLKDVRAELEFDQDRVRVVTLLGRGLHGGEFSMGGFVTPLDTKWPHVELDINASGLPVDELLQRALPAHLAAAIDTILHVPSFQRLEEAGALPDEDTVAAARRALDELLAADSGDEAPDDPELRDRRIGALRRIVANGPFKPGGTIDLQLAIRRDEGRGHKTRATGTIEIVEAGFVIDFFPYPIIVKDQSIEVTEHGVVLEDMLAETAGGGQALFSGTIEVVERDGESRTEVNLSIGVLGDLINPALIEAIPLAGRGERAGENGQPSSLELAGRLLRAGGIEGLLNLEGTIATDPGEDPTWDFGVELLDDSAVPDDSITEAMRAVGLLWPVGFALSDVRGVVRITPNAVIFDSITGSRGMGEVKITEGRLETVGAERRTSFDIEFRNLALEDYLLDLFADDGPVPARAFWDRYRPRGFFSAWLSYRSVNGKAAPLQLEVAPHEISLEIDGERSTVFGEEEHRAIITLSEDVVSFKDFALTLSSAPGQGRTNDGTLTMRGSFEPSPTGERSLRLEGELRNGRFESPWVREALSVGGAEEWRDRLQELNPHGDFDLRFVYAPNVEEAEPGSRAFDAQVWAHTLSFVFNEVPVSVVLSSDSEIHVRAEEILLNNVTGTTAQGASFRVDGRVDLAGRPVADLRIDYRGSGLHDEARAFLPRGLIGALESMNFTLQQEVEIKDAHVRLEQLDMVDEITGRRRWGVSFKGPVFVAGAAFEVGLPFSDVHARIDVNSASRPSGSPYVHLDVYADRALARGRRLHNTEAIIVLSDDGERMVIPYARADIAEGVASLSAWAGIAEHAPFQVNMDIVSADLGGISTIYESTAEDEPTRLSKSDGTVFASFSISGLRGLPEEKQGRGSVRIMDGKLANNPITLPLIQMSQFMLPIDASLKYGEAQMYIVGNRVMIEHALFEGDRIVFFGEGVLELEDFSVDLLFRTRGRVVGLSDIIGTLNDQIFAIRVSGPLHDTKAKLVPVPGLGKLFAADRPPRARTQPVHAAQASSESGE